MFFLIEILLFSSFLCQSTDMQTYMDLIEQRVMALGSKFENDYAQRCFTSCNPSYDGCSTQMPTFYCAPEFILDSCSCYTSGSPLNISASVVKLAKFPNSTENSQDITEIICASSHIDNDFIQVRQDIPTVRWYYIGSYNGMIRIYPGIAFCSNYDPRTRPWYVAAASGFRSKFLRNFK